MIGSYIHIFKSRVYKHLEYGFSSTGVSSSFLATTKGFATHFELVVVISEDFFKKGIARDIVIWF